ncbi:retrovirus-related pol polyprotein from transposon TNT 1-94 [Tanacetum coccineum]
MPPGAYNSLNSKTKLGFALGLLLSSLVELSQPLMILREFGLPTWQRPCGGGVSVGDGFGGMWGGNEYENTDSGVCGNCGKLIEIILFIVDSRCSNYMTRNLKLLSNFVEIFLRTVKFGNDQIVPILGYGDLGNDLLTGSRGTDLYSITLQDTYTPNLICLMAKASLSQAWLWHHRLSHLNFDTINFLLKYDIVTGLPKLKFVKDHLCSSLN